ncbi:hypothetical protein ACWKW1_05115 [Brevibacillus parabrevis]
MLSSLLPFTLLADRERVRLAGLVGWQHWQQNKTSLHEEGGAAP